MLKTVARDQTLTQRAFDQLEELIVSGKLKTGERLPPEAEMGQMLGVSRTVVREAVQHLSAKGLVEVRNGAGVFVRELGSSVMREPMNLLLRSKAMTVEHIVEVRAVLEVHLAGLAAARASSQDIVAMEKAIEKLRDTRLSPRECAEFDVAFHACIAAAASNPLFAIIAESVTSAMLDPIRFAYERAPTAREDTISEHTAILNCIKARQVEGARRAMLASLTDALFNWDGYPPRDAQLLSPVVRSSKRGRRSSAATVDPAK